MLQTLLVILTYERTWKIVKMLLREHRTDVSKDMETVRTIMLMVFVSKLSNDEIVREILEMKVRSSKEKAI